MKSISEKVIKEEWEETKRIYPETHAGFKNYEEYKEAYIRNAKKSGYMLEHSEKRILGKSY